jgi:hypothetical protein
VNLGQTPTPRSGRRYVRFELEITNIDSLFTSVDGQTFVLEDSQGNDHNPVLLDDVAAGAQIRRGETVTVGVVFEIPAGTQPSSLTYSPGFAAFVPFGERVRFEFTDADVFVPPRATSPTPRPTARPYTVTVRVDFGSIVPQEGPVDVGALRMGPLEIEDPHPSANRAAIPDRPPDVGTRYVAFYLPIENIGNSNLAITADNFHIGDSLVGLSGRTPDFISFGGNLQDENVLQPRFSTLVGLVLEVDHSADATDLTYVPQFEDLFSGDHNIHFDFEFGGSRRARHFREA